MSLRTTLAQHSTAQHSTAQHSTAQHSTAQHKSDCVFLAYLDRETLITEYIILDG